MYLSNVAIGYWLLGVCAVSLLSVFAVCFLILSAICVNALLTVLYIILLG